MKLALIPPVAYLSNARLRDYHLVLPQVALEYPKYMDFYKKLGSKKYMILDNGAAELGSPLPWNKIVQVGEVIGAHELVLPDVYMDNAGTKKAVQAWEDYDYHHDYPLSRAEGGRFNYMAVVTGEDFQECMKLVTWYENKKYITALGLPRHLVTTINATARATLAEMVNKLYPNRFELHMLGTNSHYMREVQLLGQLPYVRGIDTSAPFNYAYDGYRVDATREINRPKDYFDIRENVIDQQLIDTNITILNTWAYGGVTSV